MPDESRPRWTVERTLATLCAPGAFRYDPGWSWRAGFEAPVSPAEMDRRHAEFVKMMWEQAAPAGGRS